jgi:hypothetical protein
VDDQTILGGHFAATADRFAATAGTVLVLHDTTEFSFTRPTADAVGVLSYVNGRHRTHTTCGALLHSSLAVTTDRLPLALAAVTFWPRQRFTGTNAAKRTVHLVRTAVDRLAGQGTTTVARLMRREPVRGTHAVEVRDEPGTVSTATVAVRVRRLTVRPPPANRKGYGPLVLTVISAIERGRPAGREPIRWKSLTDRPVADLASAVEKLDWYAVQWKTCWRWCAWSGGGVLADHDQPGGPAAPPEVAFTPTEIAVLDRVNGRPSDASDRTVAHDLLAVAKLGGYLARTDDPPPGDTVVWRGLTPLADLLSGYELSGQLVDNCKTRRTARTP